MSDVNHNFTLAKGGSFRYSGQFLNDDNLPIDLTGSTFSGELKSHSRSDDRYQNKRLQTKSASWHLFTNTLGEIL